MANRLWALLVGIDEYAQASGVSSLRGCTADVLAMQAFLTRALGVASDQVCLLTNEQATRAGIVAAWRDHLLANAVAGDQVFFHYSGHGSQAPTIDPEEADGLDETLVAHDSRTPGQL